MGNYHHSGIFPKKDFGGEFDSDYTITEWLTQYSENKDVTYVRDFWEECCLPVRTASNGESPFRRRESTLPVIKMMI